MTEWPTLRAEVAERAAVGALMPSYGASVASGVAEDPSVAASIASYTGTGAPYSGPCSSYGAGGASDSGRCPSYGTMCASYGVGIASYVGTCASDTATTRADGAIIASYGASIASYSGPIRPNEWGWRRSGGPIDRGHAACARRGNPIASSAASVERTRGPDAGGDAPQEANAATRARAQEQILPVGAASRACAGRIMASAPITHPSRSPAAPRRHKRGGPLGIHLPVAHDVYPHQTRKTRTLSCALSHRYWIVDIVKSRSRIPGLS